MHLKTGERTNIQAGDLVTIYFTGSVLLFSVSRGLGNKLTFEGGHDDKTIINGYSVDSSGANHFMMLFGQITGLQADLKKTEKKFVLYEMMEGPSIFSFGLSPR